MAKGDRHLLRVERDFDGAPSLIWYRTCAGEVRSCSARVWDRWARRQAKAVQP